MARRPVRPDPERVHVVDLRCPDCGPVAARVERFDAEGVQELTCPGCGDRLTAWGSIPLGRMREPVVPIEDGSTDERSQAGAAEDGDHE